MPSLSHHQSNNFTKIILMGDPGTGKTGALTSLVAAGYSLGILDYDNGLETLKQFVLKECPDKIDQVEFVTLRDKIKAGPSGPVIDGQARAFADGLRLLDRWKYKDVDLGPPSEWGPGKILVIDSLDMMAKAGFDWREQLVSGTKHDPRAVYYDTQRIIEKLLQNVNSDNFETNVIIITHVHYTEDEVGVRKGYPKTIGQALSTVVGAYVNTILLAQTQAGGKRTIQTVPTTLIDLKNPKPFAIQARYPIETGLADFFEALREQPKPVAKLKRI